MLLTPPGAPLPPFTSLPPSQPSLGLSGCRFCACQHTQLPPNHQIPHSRSHNTTSKFSFRVSTDRGCLKPSQVLFEGPGTRQHLPSILLRSGLSLSCFLIFLGGDPRGAPGLLLLFWGRAEGGFPASQPSGGHGWRAGVVGSPSSPLSDAPWHSVAPRAAFYQGGFCSI